MLFLHEDPQCHVVLADFGSACKTEQPLADQAELSKLSAFTGCLDGKTCVFCNALGGDHGLLGSRNLRSSPKMVDFLNLESVNAWQFPIFQCKCRGQEIWLEGGCVGTRNMPALYGPSPAS